MSAILSLAQREKLSAYVDQRVSMEPNSGCWLWLLSDGSHGYPQGSVPIVTGERVTLAHRLSYLARHGEIPSGYDIDHLCRNRCCVNPDHLEAVTRHSNRARQFGIATAADHVSADGCPKGHGPYRIVSGRQVCPGCHSIRNKRYKARLAGVSATGGAASTHSRP